MLRLTQTEDFKTIISSCSTEEQVQKASDNFILKVVALCDTSYAKGVSFKRRGGKMCQNYSVSLTQS